MLLVSADKKDENNVIIIIIITLKIIKVNLRKYKNIGALPKITPNKFLTNLAGS